MEIILLIIIAILVAAGLAAQFFLKGSATADPALQDGMRTLHEQQAALTTASQQIQALQGHLHRTVSSEMAQGRTENTTNIQGLQTQLNTNILTGLQTVTQNLETNLRALTASNEAKMAEIRQTLETKVKELREDNTAQLDRIRSTVDEKLQTTLEKRLSESFNLVSERLAAVHQGLGEMKDLATGVGDLKKVLTNVKTRGGWGEVQLGALIDQILTPAQYGKNVMPNPLSREIVEYAVKLPGRENEAAPLWLPVDAKFFVEDYKRLHDAQEAADLEAVAASSKALRDAVLAAAKDISTKYICPPHTTDFAILFVPTEGLFAEIIRLPDITNEVQSKHRVVIAGPTTFAALLNSLQMGFRTLAIQEKSSEVWKTLGLVKGEFAKFGASLDAVKKSLHTAADKIEAVGVRTRAINRSLHAVEQGEGTLPGMPEGVLTDGEYPMEEEKI
jgi:DNA recombination protein RmuC